MYCKHFINIHIHVKNTTRLKVWDIASVDSDFTIYRGPDKRRFNNRFFAVA